MAPIAVAGSAPPDLAELEANIYSALEQVDTPDFYALLAQLQREAPAYLRAHLEMEHSLPSPSSVMDCRAALWWKGRGETGSSKTPAAWVMRQVVGVLTEPFWVAILQMAGLDMRPPTKGVPCGPHMKANPDHLIGESGLAELKSKNGWMYKRLIEGAGVAYEIPKDYYQVQSYLYATGRKWALYFCTPDSPGMLQSIMRGYKANGPNYILPLFHLEIIYPRENDIEHALARAEMIEEDKASDEPPPREYDGRPRKGLYPCNICPQIGRCQDTFG